MRAPLWRSSSLLWPAFWLLVGADAPGSAWGLAVLAAATNGLLYGIMGLGSELGKTRRGIRYAVATIAIGWMGFIVWLGVK